MSGPISYSNCGPCRIRRVEGKACRVEFIEKPWADAWIPLSLLSLSSRKEVIQDRTIRVSHLRVQDWFVEKLEANVRGRQRRRR